MANAFDHCQQLVREGDKDRFLATLFAPEKYRRPLWALYAFNLEIARVREAIHEPMAGEIRLQWWRDMLGGAGRGEVSAHPVAAALRDAVIRYGLPPQMLADLIEARAFDLYDDPMATLTELESYAARTSSALMTMAARILSDGRPPVAPEALNHAGLGLAIASLLRALPVHASRGQLYVPLDVLARHGADPADVLAGRPTEPVRAALAELRIRAREHLAEAREGMAEAPPAIWPALMPAVIARLMLQRMERRSYQPFVPLDVPQWRRQWALWRASRRGVQRAL